MGEIERGENNVTLVTEDKLARGLGITLAALLSKLEQDSDAPDDG